MRAKPQYRAVIDPPTRLVQSTLPLGVSSVLIRFCFREFGNISADLNHCPLGLQSYQNDNFDSPPTTLSLRNGALSIPPAYPSGIGLMVSISAVNSEGHIVILGKYIIGSAGGEPGTLVDTGLVRAEGDNGVVVWLRAVVGVKCVSEFTGPQCTTLLIPTERPTDMPSIATVVSPSPTTMTTEDLSTENPSSKPATVSLPTTVTTGSSTTVSSKPATAVSATTVTAESSTSTESLTTATKEDRNTGTMKDLTTLSTGAVSTGKVTMESQTSSENSASFDPTSFSPLHTFLSNSEQVLSSSPDTQGITPTGLGVGFLIGFVTAMVLAVLMVTAVGTYCIRKKRQTQGTEKPIY